MTASLRAGAVLPLCLSLLTVWLLNCKPSPDPTPTQAPPPTITSVSPVTAPVGAIIVISGTNFDRNPTNNLVQIGGVSATVVSATPTQLVVTVPVGAKAGPITVTINGEQADSPVSFAGTEKPVIVVSGDITANTTWSNTNTYLLLGMVYVPNGVTLTIQPGTIIKGGFPSNSQNPGSLVVEQGAKLMAIGTVQQPIVFTSNRPAGSRRYGDWGGLVIIGKAPHNRPGPTLFTMGVRGTYSTFNEPNDNSGSLQYVRIEFAGTGLITVSSSESEGFALYGVGSGTTIDHVQVSYSGDDSFEWFGGTVNARHLVSFRAFDDDFDTDQGYTGKVQFVVTLRDPEVADASGSNCFESDNFNPGENTTQGALAPNNGLPLTQPIFANVSSFAFADTPPGYLALAPKGSGSFQSAMHLRRNTAISIVNSVFVGWPEGLRLDGTQTGTWQNATNGSLEVQGVVLANVGTTTTTAVRGAGPTVGAAAITNEQAQTYFATPARQNQLIPLSNLPSLLLNDATFNLTAPDFRPKAGSPLLQNAITGGKLADPFFTPTTYRGAFGATDWTSGWTNWNPQNTPY